MDRLFQQSGRAVADLAHPARRLGPRPTLGRRRPGARRRSRLQSRWKIDPVHFDPRREPRGSGKCRGKAARRSGSAAGTRPSGRPTAGKSSSAARNRSLCANWPRASSGRSAPRRGRTAPARRGAPTGNASRWPAAGMRAMPCSFWPSGAASRSRVYDRKPACEPHWSPDGTRLVYETETNICTIGADGKKNRVVTYFGGVQRYGRFSPDGKSIVYCQGPSERGPWELFVIPAQGGHPAPAHRGRLRHEPGLEMTRKSIASAAVLLAIAWPIFAADVASPASATSPTTRPRDFSIRARRRASRSRPRRSAEKKGWVALAEDDVTHRFAGDAVLLNDRLAVVLRAKSAGAELYTWTASGAVQQASIVPILDGGGESKPAAVRIVENSPAAVAVEVGLQAAGASGAKVALPADDGPGDRRASPRRRRPARSASRRPAGIVAVPDFFGDDMVFTGERRCRSATGPAGGELLPPLRRSRQLPLDVRLAVEPAAGRGLAGGGRHRSGRSRARKSSACRARASGSPRSRPRESGTSAGRSRRAARRRRSSIGSRRFRPSGGPAWPGRRRSGRRGTSAAPTTRTPAAGLSRRSVAVLPRRRAGTVQIRPALLGPSAGQGPRSLAGLPDRPQPGHAADGLLPDRHPAGHAGRRAVPVHPPDRGPGIRHEPHARQRDDLRRKAVQQEEARRRRPTRSARCSPRWSTTWAMPSSESSSTAAWPATSRCAVPGQAADADRCGPCGGAPPDARLPGARDRSRGGHRPRAANTPASWPTRSSA